MMSRRLVSLIALMALAAPLGAGSRVEAPQEQVVLTAPVQTDRGATTFRIARVLLDWENQFIEVILREFREGQYLGNDNGVGKRLRATYTGAEAEALMRALNQADLSTNTLHRRVLSRLLADGKIPTGIVQE